MQSSAAADVRWLDALQRLAGRSAHELKGVLNGVSVNLEVIRSRAARANSTASAVSSFAEAASAQLDDVIELSEALLALARAPREPVDIGTELRRIAILLASAARADGHRLVVDDQAALSRLGVTSAPGSAVRVAICECLFAAVDSGAETRCHAVVVDDVPSIRVDVGGDQAISVNSDVTAVVAECGIEIQLDRSRISISFPR
jgi:signal transduction histidine kinase